MVDYDVITIGGGPGGAAASTLLAQRGYKVLLLERSRTPRFKIGESLMPATYWTLQRMGVLPRMKASHFPRKYSVQFFNKLGKASAPFYFTETDPSDSSQTWQVLRSEFDALLLDNAREHGVEIQRGALVKDVLMPLIGLAMPGGDWREAKIVLSQKIDGTPGGALTYGSFLGSLIDFVIVAFAVFMITKYLVRAEPAPAPPPTKPCPECTEAIPVAAKRCKFCTAAVPV